MYKHYALILCLSMLVTGVFAVNAKEVDLDQEFSGEILNMTMEELQEEREANDIDEVFH